MKPAIVNGQNARPARFNHSDMPDMHEISIRDARETDAPFMYDMFRKLAEHVGELDSFTSSPGDVTRDGFGEQRHYSALIAEVDGRPLGVSTYFFTYSTYAGRPCLFVLDLIVHEDARGRKLGAALLRRLAAIAVERGCHRIDLHVHRHNDAIGFYKRIGMRQTAELPFVLSGEALARMAEE